MSNVFGFPDYESLLTLHANGTVHFHAGMVSKELGAWSVIEGDPEEGEDPNDLFIVSWQMWTPKSWHFGQKDIKNLRHIH